MSEGAADPAVGERSEGPSLAADGRAVAFTSTAGESPGLFLDSGANVFVSDPAIGPTTRVTQSVANPAEPGSVGSRNPAISADGRFVAFESSNDDLAPGDGDGVRDVFVHDLATRTTTLVSRASGTGGAAADDDSRSPSISGDGRFVVFESGADNLSPDDSTRFVDVFVRDLVEGTTILVSRASGPDGAGGSHASSSPVISSDGRHVAFSSRADNFSSADDRFFDAYVRDLVAQTTTLVSRGSGASGDPGDASSGAGAISADGRYVAFSSGASNLSPAARGDPNVDVFVRDMVRSTTSLVSRAAGPSGAAGNGRSSGPSISADGRFVTFQSTADNLDPGDRNRSEDVFRRDVLGPPPSASGRACALAPLPPGPAGRPRGLELSAAQLRTNQRIGRAAVLRANAIEQWLDGGVEGRDIVGGSLGREQFDGSVSLAEVAPRTAPDADPRPLEVAPLRPGGDRITLSPGQVLTNQRVYQAAIRRIDGLEQRLQGRLTGGDVVDGSIDRGRLADGLDVAAVSAVVDSPAASETSVRAARPSGGRVALTIAQLAINQRIAAAAVRRTNRLADRLDLGLDACAFAPGSLTGADLRAG